MRCKPSLSWSTLELCATSTPGWREPPMGGMRESNGSPSADESPSEPRFSSSLPLSSLCLTPLSASLPPHSYSACADQSPFPSTSLPPPPLPHEISPCPSFNSLNHSTIHSVLPPRIGPDSRSSSFVIEFQEDHSKYTCNIEAPR